MTDDELVTLGRLLDAAGYDYDMKKMLDNTVFNSSGRDRLGDSDFFYLMIAVTYMDGS